MTDQTNPTNPNGAARPIDFNDVLIEAGPDAVREHIEVQISRQERSRTHADAQAWADGLASAGEAPAGRAGHIWGEPILPGNAHTPDIPANLLPPWIGEMAHWVAQSTQTPQAMSTMMALAVLAAVLQRRFEVAPWGDSYQETLSIWTVVVLPPGERKSAVLGALLGAVVRWEKLTRDRMRREIASNKAARDMARKRIERLMQTAARAKEPSERAALRAEIEAEEEAMPVELRAPRVFSSDCTAERLQALLVEHGERMSIFSDEAQQFATMTGMYSSGVASLDVYLQSFSGSPVRIDRGSRQAHLDRPALTVGLLVQPGVFADVAASKRLRDSGTLARFAFVLPESNVGRRDVRTHHTIPPEVVQEYEHRMLQLLEDMPSEPKNPRVLGMTDAARDSWVDFADVIEKDQGAGGRFEAIVDWTSKLPGTVARIAALIEIAAHGTSAEEVNQDSMASAIELGHLLIAHAQAAFGLLGADATDVDARAVLDWARARHVSEFTSREVQRALSGRFSNPVRLDKALERLMSHEVVRSYTKTNRGARPSKVFEVNPKALS